MILRVNRRHHSRDAYLGLLSEAGIAAAPCLYSRDGIVLEAATDVRSLPGFAEGWISVQDEAAQLAADLLDLAPGQRVLDACCAPGQNLPHPRSRAGLAGVVAVDLEAKRLVRVRKTSNAWA
jgi:16S rRNA (cytosine967-C5)-methyltransferase